MIAEKKAVLTVTRRTPSNGIRHRRAAPLLRASCVVHGVLPSSLPIDALGRSGVRDAFQDRTMSENRITSGKEPKAVRGLDEQIDLSSIEYVG